MQTLKIQNTIIHIEVIIPLIKAKCEILQLGFEVILLSRLLGKQPVNEKYDSESGPGLAVMVLSSSS